MRPAAALAERLGLPVRDLDLLQQALTHSSYLHEHRDLAAGHNERLEFLGDSVVNLAISDALYRRHPDDDEGVLSARRASIVSTAGLARLASRLELGEYLLLGEGESQRGGRRRPALLAAALEALVGALYLDLGYGAASGFVAALAGPELTSDRPLGALKSPKSRLQEYSQRLSGERPQYRLLDAEGPDHNKLFRIEVAIGARVLGVGHGHSRRLAETEAAAHAIDSLRRRVGGLANPLEDPELAEFDTDAGRHDDLSEARDSVDPEARADRAPWVAFDLTKLGMGAALAVEEAARSLRDAVAATEAAAGREDIARTTKAGDEAAAETAGEAVEDIAPRLAPAKKWSGGDGR